MPYLGSFWALNPNLNKGMNSAFQLIQYRKFSKIINFLNSLLHKKCLRIATGLLITYTNTV